MWILAFCELSKFYLNRGKLADKALDALLCEAQSLAMVKAEGIWQFRTNSDQSELALFLKEIRKHHS